MNDLIVEDIKSKIYEIRGKQVIMDSDLAKLYECKNGTKDINKAVKRNIERFPEEFYFQLSNIEYKNLKFQIGTSNVNNHGGIRKLPYVFTEQGIAMLSSVLHTEKAVKTSIQIINAFVLMQHYVSYNIDRKELYHSGSSFKDLGRKCFEITKEIETDILELLLNKIDLIYPFK